MDPSAPPTTYPPTTGASDPLIGDFDATLNPTAFVRARSRFFVRSCVGGCMCPACTQVEWGEVRLGRGEVGWGRGEVG